MKKIATTCEFFQSLILNRNELTRHGQKSQSKNFQISIGTKFRYNLQEKIKREIYKIKLVRYMLNIEKLTRDDQAVRETHRVIETLRVSQSKTEQGGVLVGGSRVSTETPEEPF